MLIADCGTALLDIHRLGRFHGVYLIANHLFRRIYPVGRNSGLVRLDRTCPTLLAVMIAWVSVRMIFRAARMLQGMFGMVNGERSCPGRARCSADCSCNRLFLPNSWRYSAASTRCRRPICRSRFDRLQSRARIHDRIEGMMVPLGIAMAVVSILVVIDRVRTPRLHLRDILTP